MLKLHKALKNLSVTKKNVKKFSNQRGGQKKRNIASFRRAINLFSGGDEFSLLSYYIEHLKTINYNKVFESSNMFVNCMNILNSLSKWYNSSIPNTEKEKILQCICPFLTRDFLRKEIGFKFSNTTFKKHQSPFDTNNRKRKRCDTFITCKKKKIEKFLSGNSRASANRNIIIKDKGKKTCKNVRYLNDNKRNLFYKFLNENKNDFTQTKNKNSKKSKISLSYFYKSVPKYFKKAKKATDKCDLCDIGKKSKIKLEKLNKITNPDTNIIACKQKLIDNIDLYEKHLEMKNIQQSTLILLNFREK